MLGADPDLKMLIGARHGSKIEIVTCVAMPWPEYSWTSTYQVPAVGFVISTPSNTPPLIERAS